jgi:hypothetical protein
MKVPRMPPIRDAAAAERAEPSAHRLPEAGEATSHIARVQSSEATLPQHMMPKIAAVPGAGDWVRIPALGRASQTWIRPLIAPSYQRLDIAGHP